VSLRFSRPRRAPQKRDKTSDYTFLSRRTRRSVTLENVILEIGARYARFFVDVLACYKNQHKSQVPLRSHLVALVLQLLPLDLFCGAVCYFCCTEWRLYARRWDDHTPRRHLHFYRNSTVSLERKFLCCSIIHPSEWKTNMADPNTQLFRSVEQGQLGGVLDALLAAAWNRFGKNQLRIAYCQC